MTLRCHMSHITCPSHQGRAHSPKIVIFYILILLQCTWICMCTCICACDLYPITTSTVNTPLPNPDHYHNLHHPHLPRSILLETGENHRPLFLVICRGSSQKLVVTGRTLHPLSLTFFVATSLFNRCNDDRKQGRPGISSKFPCCIFSYL